MTAMSAAAFVKRLVRGSLPLACAAYMLDSWLFGRRLAA